MLWVLAVICKFDDSHRGLTGLSLLVAKVIMVNGCRIKPAQGRGVWLRLRGNET